MCGICGVVETAGRDVTSGMLESMTRALGHRGPDGEGRHLDRHFGLGHTRLSIIDLAGGDQPIFNEDRSVAVVFNGEIFNYAELTEGLLARGHRFRTQSDTETLVHLYEEHGMEMLHQLRGMFSFALLDRRNDTLFLARDRFGIKPLYYQERQGRLSFASEIAPLLKGEHGVEVNRRAVHQYFLSRFAHGDETIFKGVLRLPEGTYLRHAAGQSTLHRYYPNPAIAPNPAIKDDEFEHRFESTFADAVKTWMVADVPVGAYLSGGVDSSVIVSEMTRLTDHPVRTFCVDFEHGHSEGAAAAMTASELGCEHTTVRCGIDELLALPGVVKSLEEPVGDGIVIAQYFLAKATRAAGIKTVLTGDGADETLGGYQHLRAITQLATWHQRLPWLPWSSVGAGVARRLPLSLVRAMAKLPLDIAADARTRLASALELLDRGDLRLLFDEMLSLYLPRELGDVYTDDFMREVRGFATETFAGEPAGTTVLSQVLSMQYRRWLPANINMKQDRLSMAHGVEARVPFLDHHFVELMATAPDHVKVAGATTKVALRRLAGKRLRSSVASATKLPFHLPLQHYLGDRRLWAMVEEHVDEARLRRRGFVRPEYVRAVKQQARGGDFLAAKQLFALVILEIWHRVFVDSEAA
jgi:asparagine synthase (glutamine-hydrolysing)